MATERQKWFRGRAEAREPGLLESLAQNLVRHMNLLLDNVGNVLVFYSKSVFKKVTALLERPIWGMRSVGVLLSESWRALWPCRLVWALWVASGLLSLSKR